MTISKAVMKIRRTKILAFSIIAVLIIFQMATAHSYYDSLIEADFIGTGLKFESADPDTLCVDKQSILIVAISSFSVPFAAYCAWLNPFPSWGAPSSSLEKTLSILRC